MVMISKLTDRATERAKDSARAAATATTTRDLITVFSICLMYSLKFPTEMTRHRQRRSISACRDSAVSFVTVLLLIMLQSSCQAWLAPSLQHFNSNQAARRTRATYCLISNDDIDSSLHNEDDNVEITTTTTLSNRRSMLKRSLILAGITIVSPSIAKAQAATSKYDESRALSNLAVGQGNWQPLTTLDPQLDDESTSNLKPCTGITPEFVTYGTRVLIIYDANIAQWWKVQTSRKDVDQKALFVGLATSMGRTWQQAITDKNKAQKLYQRYSHELNHDKDDDQDVIRQVNLWFAMLPDNIQPSKWEQPYQSALLPLNNNVTMENLGDLSYAEWVDAFNTDSTALLPPVYQVEITTNTQGTKAQIAPSLPKRNAVLSPEDDMNGARVQTLFGPLESFSSSATSALVTRSQPVYGPNVYALLGLAGATGCALTHATVIPLDVVKTRAQTDTSGKSLVKQAQRLVQKQGWSSLFLGAQATIAGYFWYGASVYPAYTFSKRLLTSIVIDVTTGTPSIPTMANPMVFLDNPDLIALVAGAMAAVVASLGLTPLEAARIRAVANPKRYAEPGVVGTLQVLADEQALYAGFPSLLTRQVIFGSVKFLAFERFAEFLVSTWPTFLGVPEYSWLVSLVAGGASGAISALVSQPADSLLTYVAAAQKQQQQGTSPTAGNESSSSPPATDLLQVLQQLWVEEGPGALWRGLGSRSVWAGCIIAGQFFLYDVFRTAAGVSSADLTQVWTYELHL